MHECENFQKFLALPEEKRLRIINAAMNEFRIGYKKASTDNIVREAGISKGLLFHYFGTKERLYNFLIDYSVDIVQSEYVDITSLLGEDVLESVWQLTLLKRDLSIKFPDIFDFMTSTYVDTTAKNEGVSAKLQKLGALQKGVMDQVYARADLSLFKDGIDPHMAINIIMWTMQGFGASKLNIAPAQNIGATARELYESFMQEFQQILTTLRVSFYK